ncbi:MAG: transglutaminase domain-containing protein, partial [Gammaproteobacteria bacterium]
RALVDANSVRTLAVNIASTHLENELAVLLRAAALFEYVKKNVTYVPDPIHMSGGEMIDGDYVAPPVETLDARGGDCDDQAVLIASLFSAVGIENRMRLISNTDNEWHLLTEFRVDLSLMDEFVAALDGFYDSGERDTGPRTYIHFTEDDGVWLLADTTRDYVGDYQSLMEQGFLYTS